jgi:hypothetical protein
MFLDQGQRGRGAVLSNLCSGFLLLVVQQWDELEIADLPTCGRCGFKGRRPAESVSTDRTLE